MVYAACEKKPPRCLLSEQQVNIKTIRAYYSMKGDLWDYLALTEYLLFIAER